jgi:hypothetical protein
MSTTSTLVTQAEADACNAELVARVNAEADDALAMPWWYWLLAATALVGACAMSAVIPWGFALTP